MIDETETQLLKSDFEKSFDMIFHIDNRRDKFASISFALFAAILSVVGALLGFLLKGENAHDLIFASILMICAVLMFISAGACKLFIEVLESERKANVRYRNKINLIREAVFKNSLENDAFHDYLNPEYREKFGYKFFSDGEIKGVGGTLKPIFAAMNVIMWFSAVAGVGLTLWSVLSYCPSC